MQVGRLSGSNFRKLARVASGTSLAIAAVLAPAAQAAPISPHAVGAKPNQPIVPQVVTPPPTATAPQSMPPMSSAPAPTTPASPTTEPTSPGSPSPVERATYRSGKPRPHAGTATGKEEGKETGVIIDGGPVLLLTQPELILLDKILDLPDSDLIIWILGKQGVPAPDAISGAAPIISEDGSAVSAPPDPSSDGDDSFDEDPSIGQGAPDGSSGGSEGDSDDAGDPASDDDGGAGGGALKDPNEEIQKPD